MKKTIAGFSHLNERGQAHMVNVGPKPATERHARAEAWVDVGRRVATQLRKAGATAKGESGTEKRETKEGGGHGSAGIRG